MSIPSWLEEAYKGKSIDASKLTADQQKVLFIGNYLQHPSADLGAYSSGKISERDFWGKFHHAGGSSTDYSAFDTSIKDYSKRNK